MTLLPGSRFGVYEITALIGEGGMGQVYRARDSQLKRNVALKVLPASVAGDADRLARFQREAEVLAALNHPNIAQIHGLADASGVRALVMELVEGPDIAQLLGSPDAMAQLQWAGGTEPAQARRPSATALDPARPDGFPLAAVLAIARQLVEALDCAHERGIVHRDLKPANIKVTAEGAVKVLDFGLAKGLASAGEPSGAGQSGANAAANSPTITSPAFTQAGMILGTAAYMAPEQARGRPVDKRADIWAFGCVVYELLTGQRAFPGQEVSDTLAAVLHAEPDWAPLPPSTPRPLRHLLERCLQKDPKHRLRDIGDARVDLERSSETTTTDVSEPARGVERATPHHRLWWREGLAWLAAIVATTVAGVAIWARPKPASVSLSAARVRFDLPNATRPQFFTEPILSPDGRKLLVVGGDKEGNAVWLHELDGTARRLPGTEGASGRAFWSPDGRSIAFFNISTAQLRALELQSGVSREVAQVEGLFNTPTGAWSPNGLIVFSKTARSGGLFIVPATGGIPMELTTLGDDETSHSHPSFLPDGDHILHRVRTTGGDFFSQMRSLKNPSVATRVNVGGVARAFLPPDRFFFTQGTALVEQRASLVTGDPVGEPLRVESDVYESLAVGSFALTSDVLAYRVAVPASHRRLVWFSREGTALGTLPAPPDARNPQISLDGRLAFEVFPGATMNRDIWVGAQPDETPVRLTFDAADESDQVFTADGRFVLFNKRVGEHRPVMRRDLASASPEVALDSLAKMPGTISISSVSPDGRHVISNGIGQVVVTPLDSSGREYRFEGGGGQFSPDGRYIAYALTGPHRSEIFVQPFPPTGVHWQVTTEGGTEPRWHPKGKELFYLSLDQEVMSSQILTSPVFSASPPTALFKVAIPPPLRTGVASNYAVAPDGRFLVYTLAEGVTMPGFRMVLNWQR